MAGSRSASRRKPKASVTPRTERTPRAASKTPRKGGVEAKARVTVAKAGASAGKRGRTDEFDAIYCELRNCVDLDGIKNLGDVFARAGALPASRLVPLLKPLLSEAGDLKSSKRLAALHRKWAQSVSEAAAEDPLPEPRITAKRGKLRIGLLSSDLRTHPVGSHLLPLLRNYDRSRAEIVAFSADDLPDDPVQGEIRGLVTDFLVIGKLGPRELAARIRKERIDVLVELNGMTPGTRIEALAYRAAPLQVEWLGYQFTTGLEAVDHILLDWQNLPSVPELLVEVPLLMPSSWVCFGAAEQRVPDPVPPVRRNGFVTFGTMASPFKMTRAAFSAWAQVLNAVPDSYFLVVRPEAADGEFRSNVYDAFVREKIEPTRILFYNNPRDGASHMACYDEIDIVLDSMPVTGGTTTCEALWMGVPVVTLAGESLHQRLSKSLLHSTGLDMLCTASADAYVRAAAALAGEAGTLADWRGSLRNRMLKSALGDGREFAQAFVDVLTGAAQRRGIV